MNSDRATTGLRDRKACIACTKSKRKCDKGTPFCQRCLEKDLICQYPNIRPYTRVKRLPQTSPPASDALSSHEASSAQLEARESVSVSTRDDSPHVRTPVVSPCFAHQSGHVHGTMAETSSTTFSQDPSLLTGSWFLGPETWSIDHSSINCPLPPLSASIMEIYVDQMRAWLRQWIKETQNGFIHGHLYSVTGLPHCLQNAWAALTAYFFKTRENEVATMSMIQARAEELIVQQSHNEICSATMSLLGTVEHLARVQALFVYQFIRLFDGNIRQRALAEKEIPVLFSWCRALWESATLHADSENFSLPSSPFDGADPIARLWRKWVLSESIRRMWIITHFTQSVYFTMRDGWTNCPGGVCFTARQGLWDASSSDAWANLLGTHDPWFFSCAHANQLLMIAEPGRVDSFSELLLKMLWGNEKIENWMKNGSAVSNLTLN